MAVPSRPILLSRPVGERSPAGLDRTRRMAWHDVQRTDINQRLGPFADPTQSHWIHKLNLGNDYKLLYGRIVDSVAYANAYKVQLESGSTTMWCSAAVQTALQPMGSRQFGQIAIGAAVFVAVHPSEVNGIILCVLPEPQTNSRNAGADFISQAARSGLLVDAAHTHPFQQTNASFATDWSSGRPFDATTEGETGHITETGLLGFLDSFMTANRVDEECGVWHFYPDSLTRIAGHNLELRTSGHERDDIDDEGEVSSIEGYTPYYWEALGAITPTASICREISSECWQMDPDYQQYSAQEPCSDEQQPFYRLRKFKGYLGQGYKKILSLPPISSCLDVEGPQGAQDECDTESPCDNSELNLLHSENMYPGVYEENLSLTGRLSIRTAHEYIVSKQLIIPAPKQVILPNDISGDNRTDYKAAGELGAGPSHDISGSIDVVSGNQSQIKALGFLDTHAFVFNWVNNHPFHYHTKDWYLPEESEMGYPDIGCEDSDIPAIDFEALIETHFMDAPEAIPLNVDHRYGDVNYYPNHSYFGLLDDGGVVLGDGFGSEIKMANGHIWITTPGDINLQSGRNTVVMSGKDFMARAKNSVDITATERDVRIKSHNNLWLCASGITGGVLIQSNAIAPALDFTNPGEEAILGGIVFKAATSLISMCGQNLAFNLTDPTAENSISFDTGWCGKFKVKSKFFERFLTDTGAALDYWVTPDGSGCDGTVQSGNEYWKNGAIICMPLVVNDKLFVNDCGIFNNSVVINTGHIFTQDSTEWAGCVGQVNSTDTTNYTNTFEYFDSKCEETTSIGSTELTTFCEYQCGFNLCDAEFSFRTVAQYRTDDFVLYENRWQQLARLSGASVSTWTEEEINDTYPYPGKEILLGSTYMTLDPVLYDDATGKAVDRGSIYVTPTFNAPVAEVLNDNYTVIG